MRLFTLISALLVLAGPRGRGRAGRYTPARESLHGPNRQFAAARQAVSNRGQSGPSADPAGTAALDPPRTLKPPYVVLRTC